MWIVYQISSCLEPHPGRPLHQQESSSPSWEPRCGAQYVLLCLGGSLADQVFQPWGPRDTILAAISQLQGPSQISHGWQTTPAVFSQAQVAPHTPWLGDHSCCSLPGVGVHGAPPQLGVLSAGSSQACGCTWPSPSWELQSVFRAPSHRGRGYTFN